jgi:hypothetical protein
MQWSEHLSHLTRYLQVIKKSGLTLSLRKCKFAQDKVVFVGHVIGSGLKEVDPSKVSCLAYINAPTTKKEVRKLMGFFSYFRSFIPNMAETAQVITNLTRKDVHNKFVWKTEHEAALNKLKFQLSNSVVLHSIDFTKPFGLLVDASQSAVGVCLIQWTDGEQELPLALASMKLSPVQTRWSTIECEAFAVIWALKKFRPWILLSPITVFPDHNPLSYLTETTPKSAKLTRWALSLQEFNITSKYRAAGKNVAADFLSRI